MKFTYTRFFDEEHFYDFEYEPSKNEILWVLADILIREATDKKDLTDIEYKVIKRITKQIIEDADVQAELEIIHEEALKEWFYEDAIDSERNS